MKRRTFLGTVAVGTAGCLGSGTPPDDAGGSQRTTDVSRTDGPTTAPTTELQTMTDDLPGETDENGTDPTRPADGVTPPPERSAFARDVEATDCPAVDESADLRVCSTTTDRDEVPVFLAPAEPVFAPTTGDGDVESLRVVLENRGDAPFGFNPYAWSLHRRADGAWTRVGPEAWPEPWRTLAPGEQFTYDLRVEAADGDGGAGSIERDLETGIYALAVSGQREGDGKSAERIECVAVFGVDRGGQ